MTPVTRGEVEAAVNAAYLAGFLQGRDPEAKSDDGSRQMENLESLLTRLFAERDEAESRARVCREDVEINAARAEKADAAVMALKRDLASVVLALGSTTTMLEFEAVSHEESGDAKRATYVQENKAKPTRDEIALRFAVALAGGDWACPNEMNSPSAEVARLSFEYADAFIAARDGAR